MKLICLVLTVALMASCGSRAPVYESPPSARQPNASLPDPVAAAPAFIARLQHPAGPNLLAGVAKTPGVAVAAPVRIRMLAVKGPDGWRNLRVAAVDPLQFRAVAPAATRDADFVWGALVAGEAVATFDAAQILGVSGPAEVSVGKTRIRVAALADNGSPNIADILVADFVGDELRVGGARMLVVGASSGVTLDSLARPLRHRLPGVKLSRIAPHSPKAAPAPRSVGASSETYVLGGMRYQILPNGFIRPDPEWVRVNIASGAVPILGSVTCHRAMLPQLAAAFAEIEQRGLAGEIYEYGGCYVPRFIDRDPSRSLSMHAFGLAIDLNVPTNALGTRGDMHPDVVAIFEKWGFAWGGRWSEPDPMHFELARLIQI